MKPRVPLHDEESLPALPPLDGDADEPARNDDDALLPPEYQGAGGLDDAEASDLESGAEIVDDEAPLDAGDADDADDADVGDLADEIDRAEVSADDASEAADDPPFALSVEETRANDDDDAEGPLGDDGGWGGEARADAADSAAGDDEERADPIEALAVAPPAFDLRPPAVAPAFVRVEASGLVLAAVALPRRIVLVGDGVHALAQSTLGALDQRARSARRIAAPSPELLASVVALGAHALVAATVHGALLRSDDEGANWDSLGNIGAPDVAHAAVELCAETESARLWARAHGGGLFRSDDGGQHWDGPLALPPARMMVADARGAGVVLVASAGWSPRVLRAEQGGPFHELALALDAAPTVVALRGELCVVACARGDGVVSLDGGRTGVRWPLLASATALALLETDDGAPQLLAAIHDEQADRSTLVHAAIDRAGRPRAPRRVADLEALLPSDGDDADARVEALLPLDPAGRRVLVLTAQGAVVLGRDEL